MKKLVYKSPASKRQDVNDNMKMQQSQSSQELDLVKAEPEDFTEDLTKGCPL